MSRAHAIGADVLALAAGAIASGGALAHADRRVSQRPLQAVAGVATAAHLQVTQIEYRLLLSRGVVKAGTVDLQALDRGMDPHDLRLRAVSSTRELVAPQLTPGQRWNGTVNLSPGVYRLWCSLPEHAARGMHATLTVVR
jgi:hypothetical protein